MEIKAPLFFPDFLSVSFLSIQLKLFVIMLLASIFFKEKNFCSSIFPVCFVANKDQFSRFLQFYIKALIIKDTKHFNKKLTDSFMLDKSSVEGITKRKSEQRKTY
jgi:hypothetical protein